MMNMSEFWSRKAQSFLAQAEQAESENSPLARVYMHRAEMAEQAALKAA